MHRVEQRGALWESAVWGDAGQIVRLHGTPEQATRWARVIDGIMNPARGVPRPSVPATQAMLRTRLAMLAQTCLARSQAVEPSAPRVEKPEPAKDLGDPRIGEPGVDIVLCGDSDPRPNVSPGAFYTPAVRKYWLGLFQICFDLLQRIDKRPATRPMPGRMGMVPCRYRCGRMVEQPALLISILAENGLELAVGCGCYSEPPPGPPSEDSEPPPPMPPPPEPLSERMLLALALAIPAERDAGTIHRRMCAALPLLAAHPSSTRAEPPPPEPDEPERPEPDEREPDEREPEPDQLPPPEDDWIF